MRITRASKHRLFMQVIESALRREILIAFEASPELTVAQLARQLGRRPDGLYHHLRALQSVGLIRPGKSRVEGGRPAAVWSIVRGPLHVTASSPERVTRRHAERVVRGMVRSSVREFVDALERANAAPRTEVRPVAARYRVWLSAAEQRALMKRMREMLDAYSGRGPGRGKRPVLLTYVLASVPVPEPAKPARARRTKRA